MMGTELEEGTQDPLDGDQEMLSVDALENQALPGVGLGEKVPGEKRSVRRMKQMDVLRRQKDRSYKNVFKGSVLVGTLMDHDESKFATRTSAIKFAQKLLDAGHIESIVGSSVFEDSVHLYRWADETVVREAKKMVSTTSHIPRKKLIELVDMNQGDLTDDTYDMRDVKDKLIAKFQAERPTQMTFATKEERRASRKERALRRRTLGAVQIGDAMEQLNQDGTAIVAPGRRRRTRDDNHLVLSNNSTNLSRGSSMSQETLHTNGYGSGAEEQQIRPRRRRRNSSPPAPPVPSSMPPTEGSEENSDPAAAVPVPRKRGTSALVTDNSSQNGQDSIGTTTPIVNGLSEKSPSKSANSKPEGETNESPVPCPEPTCTDKSESNRTTSDSNNNASKSSSNLVSDKDPKLKQDSDPKAGAAKEGSVDEEGNVSTCVYDGVEMKALDIETLDFDLIRPAPSESLEAINRSLDKFAEQSCSYSDNEKQLFEQMKRMQVEHEKAVKGYEDRLGELLTNMAELRHLVAKVDTRNGLLQHDKMISSTGSINGGLDDSSISSESDLLSLTGSSAPGGPAPIPPAPPAPPPLPPPGMTTISKVVKPSKSPIKTKLKMRPLFWNRIILDSNQKDKDPTFWHLAKERKFDLDGFERLFGKADDEKTSRAKSLHDAMSSGKGKGKMEGQGGPSQTAKILEQNRSRAVAIKLRTMHCQMSDIKQAVYNMDFSKIDLESIYSLYLIKGTKSELDKISVHLQCHEDVALDQPEQFLWELSKMSHFPERIECMMLQKRFNETLFNIDQQLSTVETACEEIRHNTALRTVLETILTFGNYMNGSTQRGQADGFEYTILAKVKDVRSMDNSTNLLQYIVRAYTKDFEKDAGKEEAVFRLPDPSVMSQAATVSFSELDVDLNSLHHQLHSHKKKAQLVCEATEPKLVQPFKDKMDDFFDTAEAMIKDQQEKLADTQAQFQYLLRYLAVKDSTEQTTPETLFSVWAQFCESFKTYWKLEHKRIARMMFEKVEQSKRKRMSAARRRKSTAEDGKSGLKQRFARLRKQSEVNPTVKMLRSQSMVESPSQAESDSDICAPKSAPPDGQRRRRRPHSDVYESEQLSYHSDASVTSARSETMAERMQRRRRSRINSEEVQTNIQNARQEGLSGSPRARPKSLGDASDMRRGVANNVGASTEQQQQPLGSSTNNNNSINGGLTKPARMYGPMNGTGSNDAPQGYASDSDKMTRRAWRLQQAASAATDDEAGGTRRRRRPGVITRDDGGMGNGEEPALASSPRRYRMRNSDSLTSLTDVARYKPAGDRSPIIPPTSGLDSGQGALPSQHFTNMGYKKRSRYGQQYDSQDSGRGHSVRAPSPAGSHTSDYSAHDPGAPPRPALPAAYNNFRSQGSSESDIMDTDQEKINYREAIRKMSGTRRRSGEQGQKGPDMNNRRPQDISPMGRLR